MTPVVRSISKAPSLLLDKSHDTVLQGFCRSNSLFSVTLYDMTPAIQQSVRFPVRYAQKFMAEQILYQETYVGGSGQILWPPTAVHHQLMGWELQLCTF